MAVIYGINPASEALAAGDEIEKIIVERRTKNPRIQEIIDLCRKRHIPVSFEEKSWLDRRAAGARHQGVIGYVAEVAFLDQEELLRGASSPGLLLILDGIEDPGNLGAILRSAEVAGVDGVFLPQRRSAGLGAAAVRASAGAAAHVRIAHGGNTARLIESLQRGGYWVCGLAAESPRPLWEADFTVPTALVLGSEGTGLRRLVKEKCDFLLSIPIKGRVSSYNVSVAAGIALYEVLRQRADSSGAGNPR